MKARILLPLGSLALVLAAAEIFARLALPPPEIHVYLGSGGSGGSADSGGGTRGRPAAAGGGGSAQVGDGSLYVATPAGIRLRPGTRVIIQHHALSGRTIEIATNALGYRGPEVGPKTRKRVLFLGDSITFGDYLPEDETFVRLVERLSASGPTPLETLNAGVSMAGLASEIASLHETGLSTRPDVVVLGFYLNDLQDSVGIELLKPPGWLRRSALAHHLLRALSVALAGWDIEARLARITSREWGSDFSLETWRRWRVEVERRFPAGEGDPTRDRAAFNRLVHKNFMDWGVTWSDEAWAYMTPVFRQYRELADRHGFAPRIVVFPVRQQVVADFVANYPQEKLREVGRSLGIPVLDLLPLLREQQRRRGEPLFYDHAHHTPLGNRIIAEAILDFLARTTR